MVEWPRGEARDCKSLYTGSNPVSTSIINQYEIGMSIDQQEWKNLSMNSQDESQRPWGRYEILQESAIHKTKCIYVLPGKRLSYQRHQKRAEHWFIIQGDAEVTLEGKVAKLSSGDTISIAQGQLHRIANIGNNEVIFIEVQTGTYFGEDDIERIEDDFGR